ncbi:hypothetical protein JW835_11455 [bacterium]|nr:hypothetical protein [bacterium]
MKRNILKLAITYFMIIFVLSCQKQNPAQQENVPVEQLIQDFDSLWIHFDELYPYFIYKNMDWNAAYDRYRPELEDLSDYLDLIDLCVQMLRPMRDLHVNFLTPEKNIFRHINPITGSIMIRRH